MADRIDCASPVIRGGISRRRFFTYTGAAMMAAYSGWQPTLQAAARPNILLIVADDLGLQLGCCGDPVARTPRINALAAQGMRFANSYVTQAACAPSRSSILTGLYPHQNGQVGQVKAGYQMHAGIATLPVLLKAAGYRTGLLGKQDVDPESAFRMPDGSSAWDVMLRAEDLHQTRDGQLVAQSADQLFFRHTEQPFFAMVNYKDPHVPFYTQVYGQPLEPYDAAEISPFPFQGFATPEMRERTTAYYNCVARLDALVGMLLDKLEASGRARSTMVVFLGDHGPTAARAKVTCYEAGLRTPLIVRWPGSVPTKQVNRSLVSTIDLLPTLLRAAGAVVPADLPGRPLQPLFKGITDGWRSLLAAEYTDLTPGYYYPQRSIRGAGFKYILTLEPGRVAVSPQTRIDADPAYDASRSLPASDPCRIAMDVLAAPPAEQLYDLRVDPYEYRNLAGSKDPDILSHLRHLRRQLRLWREHTDDPMLTAASLSDR